MHGIIVSHDINADAGLQKFVRITPAHAKFQMWLPRQDTISREQIGTKSLVSIFVSRIARHANLFVDIGARYGYFDLLVAENNPKLSIAAFESNSAERRLLIRNLAVHGLRCQVLSQIVTTFNSINAIISGIRDAKETDFSVLIRISTAALLRLHLHSLEYLSTTDAKLIIEFKPLDLIKHNYDPSELFVALDAHGFATFIIDDTRAQFFALSHPKAWPFVSQHQSSSMYLYCIRKANALNVLFFSHGSKLMGAERSLLELVDELVADYGVICSVVVPSCGPLSCKLEESGAAVIISPKMGTWWAMRENAATGELRRKLIDAFRELRFSLLPLLNRIDPDVVFTQSMVLPWGAVAASLLGRPHVWSICEFGELDHGFHFLDKIEVVCEQISRGSDLLFVACNLIKETMFPNVNKDRCKTLYRYIDMPNNVEKMDGLFKRPASAHLGLFATLMPSKGQHDAVCAVKHIVDKGHDIELLLAGHSQPEYKSHILDLVADLTLHEHIHVLEFIEEPYPAMASVDIILVCSRNEAFGRSAAEAMLLGKPIVYARRSGVSEYMIDRVTGISYEPGNIGELAGAILELIEDPDFANRIAKAAAARAQRIFSKRNYGGQVFDCLQDLKKKNRGHSTKIPSTLLPFMYRDSQ